MVDGKGLHLDVTDGQTIKWQQRLSQDSRNTSVFVFAKYVGKSKLQIIQHALKPIDWHINILSKDKRACIIYSYNVIIVLVRQEHAIKTRHPCLQHLLPEIRASIDANGRIAFRN